MRSRARLVIPAVAGALLSTACASDTPGGASVAVSGGPGMDVSVVATTTVWADIATDIVQCAGGARVPSLTPVGADPHDFSPSSQDIATLVSADLVVANGLGLEEGLAPSVESARADGAHVLELAEQLDPMPLSDDGGPWKDEHAKDEDAEAGHSEDADAEPGHSGLDPHVWLDAARVAKAATLIGAELAQLTGDRRFEECAGDVEAELADLDDQVSTTLATVAEPRRILVTDHDALDYLAAAYGYTVAGTVIPGGSTLAEPSSAELAELAETVRRAQVPAIFANTANPQALVDALAAEVGDVEVVELYVGSLGEPGSGADTYAGFMTTNAERISQALAD